MNYHRSKGYTIASNQNLQLHGSKINQNRQFKALETMGLDPQLRKEIAFREKRK